KRRPEKRRNSGALSDHSMKSNKNHRHHQLLTMVMKSVKSAVLHDNRPKTAIYPIRTFLRQGSQRDAMTPILISLHLEKEKLATILILIFLHQEDVSVLRL
ncbi:hypothetical protein GCK32_006249, partial [Trichostrongylus colubriformis]